MFLLRQFRGPNLSQDDEYKTGLHRTETGNPPTPKHFQPTADIWLKSKQAWFIPPDETDHFEGPPDFKEFLET